MPTIHFTNGIYTGEYLRHSLEQLYTLVAHREQVIDNRSQGHQNVLQRGAFPNVGAAEKVQNLQSAKGNRKQFIHHSAHGDRYD